MAAETGNGSPKWQGKLCAELKGVTADQAWPHIADFCNIHKYFPVDVCYQIEGVLGQPGLVRYVESGTSVMPSFSWTKEKLIAINHVERRLNYQLLDNNLGFDIDSNYFVTQQILPVGDEEDCRSCKIEYSFITGPNKQVTLETWLSYLDFCLKEIAKKISLAVLGGAAESK